MRKKMELGFALILLFVSTVAAAQMEEQFRTLVINDQSGKVVVLEVGDRTYVDLKRLVQIGHGSIEYRGNQIIVSLSGTSASNSTKRTTEAEQSKEAEQSPEAGQSTNVGLSREFMKAGIEEISLLREWASSLANSLQNGYPVSENWVAGYRAKAHTGVGIVAAAVSTEGDRSAAELLNREFEAVQEWSNKLMDARKSMDAAKYALSPNALQNDPLSQRIITCGRFLGQMLASGSFQDDASCH
jgi:hypothetical protein